MKQSKVGFLRDLHDGDGDAVNFTREIGRHFADHRFQTLFYSAGEFFVLPPWLDNMVVSDDLSLTRDEPGAKKIGAYFRATSFGGVDRIAFAVLQRTAVTVGAAVAQAPSGNFLVEGHGDMQQADAGSE